MSKQDKVFKEVVMSVFDNAYGILCDAIEDAPDDWDFTAEDLRNVLLRVLRAIKSAEGISIPTLEEYLDPEETE